MEATKERARKEADALRLSTLPQLFMRNRLRELNIVRYRYRLRPSPGYCEQSAESCSPARKIGVEQYLALQLGLKRVKKRHSHPASTPPHALHSAAWRHRDSRHRLELGGE